MAKILSFKEKNELLKPFGKQLIAFGVKVQVNFTETQEVLVHKTFGCTRLVYNEYLGARQDFYKENGKSLSPNTYKKEVLNPSKKTEEREFLKEVDKNALENALANVQDAYDRFFKGQNRYPKFKSKKSNKKAYTTNFTQTTAGGNIRINDTKTLQLPKLGKVKFFMPKYKDVNSKIARIIKGNARITKATISQKGSKYYVSFVCQEEVDLIRPLEKDEIDLNKVVGGDLGLSYFLTYNNGLKTLKIDNPRYLRNAEKKLIKLQKRLSKKTKGSKNYEKARKLLANYHAYVSNCREDFLHKLSRQLVNENQVVVLEDLNIKGMIKNKRLSKSISDAGWSKFITFLKYKLEWEGKHLVLVDRWFASSKICSHCGEKKLMLALNEREWVCSCCGKKHDRDENASKNIREEGIKILLEKLAVA